MVSDGSSNTYEWDTANRLAAINYTATGGRSEFTYNGLSQRVKIVEKENGSVTSTKQFVWCPEEPQPSEERDGSNNVTKRYFPQALRLSRAGVRKVLIYTVFGALFAFAMLECVRYIQLCARSPMTANCEQMGFTV
jgi:YD repeat-containing protein